MPTRDQIDVGAFALERNTQVDLARGLGGVKVEGLAQLRKSLRDLDKGLARDFQKSLKEAVEPIRSEAAALAPRRSGRLAASIRPFARGNTVGIRSPLPYANLIHWGGSTGRGHMPGVEWSGSIFVRESLFMSRALERREGDVIERVVNAMDEAERRAGWH